MNDDDTTARMPTAPEPEPDGEAAPSQQPAGPRRLLRSRGDRVLGGVAGGLGNYFSVDPVIIRIAFAISAFFGGIGALAYIALVLFVPSEAQGDESPQTPLERSRWLTVVAAIVLAAIAIPALGSVFFWGDGWGWGGGGFFGLFLLIAAGAGIYLLARDRDRDPERPIGLGRTLAFIAIAVAAAFGLLAVATASALAAATGSGEVIAAIVIGIGALLALAAIRGGARWLIAPALALAIPLGLVSAADISFAGGVGDRSYRPASQAAVADRYELGVGRLIVDLRDFDWSESARIPLEVDLGLGEATVVIPDDVCVAPSIDVRGGEIVTGAGVSDGVDVSVVREAGPTTTPALILDGDLEFGTFRVLNEYSYESERGPFDRDDRDAGQRRADVC